MYIVKNIIDLLWNTLDLLILLLFFKVSVVGHIHMPHFGATGTRFWISSEVFSGFQSKSGFCLLNIA